MVIISNHGFYFNLWRSKCHRFMFYALLCSLLTVRRVFDNTSFSFCSAVSWSCMLHGSWLAFTRTCEPIKRKFLRIQWMLPILWNIPSQIVTLVLLETTWLTVSCQSRRHEFDPFRICTEPERVRSSVCSFPVCADGSQPSVLHTTSTAYCSSSQIPQLKRKHQFTTKYVRFISTSLNCIRVYRPNKHTL